MLCGHVPLATAALVNDGFLVEDVPRKGSGPISFITLCYSIMVRVITTVRFLLCFTYPQFVQASVFRELTQRIDNEQGHVRGKFCSTQDFTKALKNS